MHCAESKIFIYLYFNEMLGSMTCVSVQHMYCHLLHLAICAGTHENKEELLPMYLRQSPTNKYCHFLAPMSMQLFCANNCAAQKKTLNKKCVAMGKCPVHGLDKPQSARVECPFCAPLLAQTIGKGLTHLGEACL